MMLESRYTCPIMIGRQREMDALGRIRAQVEAGAGRTVLIAGEAGVGKSRLLAGLVEQARKEEWSVLVGHCYPQDINLPYGPLLDALRTYLHPLSPDHTVSLLGPYAPEFIKLLPELSRLFPNIQPEAPLEPQAEKRRLFEAIYGFISDLARGRPLLLAFEDLHWADNTSLELLHLLARRIAHDPVLLITTYRLDEPVSNPGSLLLRHITDLERERLATEIRLDPLPLAGVSTMIELILDLDILSPELTTAIHSRTEGNPFFVEELLKALVESGDLFFAEGTWNRKALEELNLPRSVREAILRHLDGLDPQVLQVALTAAAIGRQFDFELLRAVTGLSEEALVDTLRTLISRQIISVNRREVGESEDLDMEGDYRFRHALTRDAIYNRLLPQERKAAHRLIAETIEKLYAGELEAHWTQLAYHFWEARVWDSVLKYSALAGEKALKLNAPHSAIESLTRALTAARHIGGNQPARLYRLRGQAAETLGDFESARSDLETALQMALDCADRLLEWNSLIDLGFLWAGRDYERTGDYFNRALELARQIGDPDVLGHSLNRCGNWLMNTGRAEEGLTTHREALSLFQGQGDKAGTAQTLDLLGMAYGIYADTISSLDSLERSIKGFRESGDNRGLAGSLSSYVAYSCPSLQETTLTEPGVKKLCEDRSEEAIKLTERIDWQAGRAYALFAGGSARAGFGNLGKGLHLAGESLRVATEIEHQQWIIAANYTLSQIYIYMLASDKAIEHARLALEQSQALGSDWWADHSAANLGTAYLMKGDLTSAERALRSALPEGGNSEPHTLHDRRAFLAWGELALARGDEQEALRIAERLIESVPAPATSEGSERFEAQPIPALLKLKSEALRGMGREPEALQTLEEARRGALEREWYPLLWQIQTALGQQYCRLKREEQSRSEFQAARTVIEDLAATIDDSDLRALFLKEALGRLPQTGTKPDKVTQHSYPAGLTPREMEVLRLVAAGKSNRQVAEELFLSERTVETHLTSILAKTHAENRAGATAFAYQQGLL